MLLDVEGRAAEQLSNRMRHADEAGAVLRVLDGRHDMQSRTRGAERASLPVQHGARALLEQKLREPAQRNGLVMRVTFDHAPSRFNEIGTKRVWETQLTGCHVYTRPEAPEPLSALAP